ncbi:HAD-IA family hydrolase [Vibrio mimicus]|uniref:HAD-IA family hydrolase n=1 Tax=Vibrio mimicus TaxID=674 RepID=UPI0012AD0B43|nr:HAD-IA family hydrolase [Vibrio mimicus]
MELDFRGLLFDLDGTLVDSSEVITRAWEAFGLKYNVDADIILPTVQGKPTYEAIKALRPEASHEDVTSDALWLEAMEAKDTEGVIALPGSLKLLNALNDMNIPWAIVTSGTLPVATARIKAANLPFPQVLVTPELISKGKPDPEPYLLGASKLGLEATDCIVFEDAPAGVISGVSAGSKVIGILSQFDKSILFENKATVCVSSLSEVSLLSDTVLFAP